MQLLNDNTKEYVTMNFKIYAIDYDGTIDFAGFPNVGKILPEAIDAIKYLQNKGDKIILWTCRDNDYLKSAIDCMKNLGITFDAVNENLPEVKELGFSSPKILANVYIDDIANGRHTALDMREIFMNILSGEL